MQTIGLLLKVLWSPGEAMFVLSKNPRVIVPVLFMTLCSVAGTIAVQSKVSYGEMIMTMTARTPQGRQMPEEAKANMQRLMSSPIVKGFIVGSATIMPFILVLLVTVIYFGLFSMLGREGGFKSFLSITAFAFVPTVFSIASSVVRAFTMPASFLMLDELGSLSPAPFIDRDSVSPVMFAAVNSVDLISIWTLALLVIGYGFVTRKSLSAGTRSVAVISVFLIYQVLKLGYTAISS